MPLNSLKSHRLTVLSSNRSISAERIPSGFIPRPSQTTFVLVSIALTLGIGAVIFHPLITEAQSLQPTIVLNTSSDKGLSSTEVFAGLKISLILAALTLLPSILMSVTCFTRIAIVLSLTRQAMGTMQTPPTQMLVGLSLFLTFAIMSPVFTQIYNEALLPYSEDQLSNEEALTKAFAPLKTFMLKHTRQQDLELFVEILKIDVPEDPETLGAPVVVPAFMVSELNAAFQIAFLIFLPFLILDMIISSVLTSMSMITLPPTVISLPLKLMLFVVIDGWHLIIGNLVKSYQ